MFHDGPIIASPRPFSAVGGALSARSASPRSSVLSSRNSPRGMLSSQALKEMYLRTASRATVDAMTYWDNHVAVTNMRQAVMREQHEMRLSSRPTSARDVTNMMASSLTPRSMSPRQGKKLPLDMFGPITPRARLGLGADAMLAAPSAAAMGPAAPAPAAGWTWTIKPGITINDLQFALVKVKEQLLTKHGSFTKAFRSTDTDASGQITDSEFRAMLQSLNLESIRPAVIDSLMELIDYDDDDEGEAEHDIKYEEFRRMMACDHVSELLPDHPDHPKNRKAAPVAAPVAAKVVDNSPPSLDELDQVHKFICATLTLTRTRTPTLTRCTTSSARL